MAKHTGSDPADSVGGAAPDRDQPRPIPATGPKHAVPGRARRNRTVGLVILALVAATAVIVVSRLSAATPDAATPNAASPDAGSSDQAAPATSSTSADTSQSLTAAPVTGEPTSSEQSGSAITADSVWATLAGLLPPTGPGLSEPGIALIASPTPDGSFDIVERIRLDNPVTVLTLRPAPVDRAGQQFASASAAATEVQVSVGDQPVRVPGATVAAPMDVGLPIAEADRFELHYRLAGATVRSTPSTAGRALAAIGPLTGGVDQDLPVLVIVTGGTVLGLNCPLLPLSEQSCGSRTQTTTGVERVLPWRLALTSVQFNLPTA